MAEQSAESYMALMLMFMPGAFIKHFGWLKEHDSEVYSKLKPIADKAAVAFFEQSGSSLLERAKGALLQAEGKIIAIPESARVLPREIAEAPKAVKEPLLAFNEAQGLETHFSEALHADPINHKTPLALYQSLYPLTRSANKALLIASVQYVLAQLSHEEMVCYVDYLGTHPDIQRKLTRLFALVFYSGGSAPSSCLSETRLYMDAIADVPIIAGALRALPPPPALMPVVPQESLTAYLQSLFAQGYRVKASFGRSLRLEKLGLEEVKILKFCRPSEPAEALQKEAEMDRWATDHLKSEVPTPHKIITTSAIDDAAKASLLAHGMDEAMYDAFAEHANLKQVTVLEYDASPGYLIYAPDITDINTLRDALLVMAEDAATLYHQKGLFLPQLLNVMHTALGLGERGDGGHHLSAPHIVRKNLLPGLGLGQVTNVESAVAFANCRQSGFADLGDAIHASALNAWNDPDSYVRRYFPEAQAEAPDSEPASYYAENFVLFEMLARYIFSFSLLISAWGQKHLPEDKTVHGAFWLSLTDLTLTVYAKLYSAMAKVPLDEANTYVQALCKKQRHAGQAALWFVGKYGSAFLESDFAMQRQIAALYSKHSTLVFGGEHDLKFPAGLRACGYFSCHEESRDLGTNNGPIPLTEDGKIRLLLVRQIINRLKQHSPEAGISVTPARSASAGVDGSSLAPIAALP